MATERLTLRSLAGQIRRLQLVEVLGHGHLAGETSVMTPDDCLVREVPEVELIRELLADARGNRMRVFSGELLRHLHVAEMLRRDIDARLRASGDWVGINALAR